MGRIGWIVARFFVENACTFYRISSGEPYLVTAVLWPRYLLHVYVDTMPVMSSTVMWVGPWVLLGIRNIIKSSRPFSRMTMFLVRVICSGYFWLILYLDRAQAWRCCLYDSYDKTIFIRILLAVFLFSEKEDLMLIDGFGLSGTGGMGPAWRAACK